jgi:hypothetical protein
MREFKTISSLPFSAIFMCVTKLLPQPREPEMMMMCLKTREANGKLD